MLNACSCLVADFGYNNSRDYLRDNSCYFDKDVIAAHEEHARDVGMAMVVLLVLLSKGEEGNLFVVITVVITATIV